ncbi:MAG: TolC family protein [Phycisphaerales bacterium]
MVVRQCMRASSAALGMFILAGCSSSPFDLPNSSSSSSAHRLVKPSDAQVLDSIYRPEKTSESSDSQRAHRLDSTPESFVRSALFESPLVEQGYQRWRSASHRLPQVRSLPDPRLNIGFFLNEVETRVGPQQAKVGLQQTFPWLGKLQDREDAAAKGALAAWYQYQEVQLAVVAQVMVALHELVYLDHAIRITKDNEALLESFEEVVRARYRVGSGSHPEMIRVQVEFAQLQDRVLGLEALRPSYIARLNAVLNRPPEASIPEGIEIADVVSSIDAQQVEAMAQEWNPTLRSTHQRIEQARIKTDLAHKEGFPDLTVGLEYVLTDHAANPSIPESGDDPVMLTFGMNLPIWREKYDAGVREAIANRLSISRSLDAQTNALAAKVYKAWFEHTDADRRVRLYEESLIPKAQESLSASLAEFRTGDSEFLDLLDTERTLLEFSIAAQRARADRGKALATLNHLVGHPVPTRAAQYNRETNTETISDNQSDESSMPSTRGEQP